MAESRTLRVLALLDQGGRHVYRELAAPLLRHLSECRGVAVDLDGRIADHDVLLCAHDRVPDERLAAEITRFVNRGGGVVADSNPAAEYEETLVKAKAMFAAIGINEI